MPASCRPRPHPSGGLHEDRYSACSALLRLRDPRALLPTLGGARAVSGVGHLHGYRSLSVDFGAGVERWGRQWNWGVERVRRGIRRSAEVLDRRGSRPGGDAQRYQRQLDLLG